MIDDNAEYKPIGPLASFENKPFEPNVSFLF